MRARRRINTEISALMVEKNVIYKDSKIEELVRSFSYAIIYTDG